MNLYMPSHLDQDPRLLRFGVVVFIVATICLDVQFPTSSFKVGNLVMLLGAAFAVICALMARSHANRFRYTLYTSDWIYLTYIAWCGASLFWSKSRLETAVQTLLLLAVWITAVHLRSAPTRVFIGTIIKIALATSLVSFAIAAAFPSIGFQPHSTTGLPELRGFFGHQQRLGLFCSLALGLLIIAWANRELAVHTHWGRASALAAGAVIALAIVGAQARLFTAGFLLALALTFAVSRPGIVRQLTVTALVITCALLAANMSYVLGLIDAAGLEGNSLSGRTLIWERSMEVANAAPVEGHGYASFFSSHFDYLWGNYRAPHAHSSFIQAYFETGVVGLGLTVLLCLVHVKESYRVGTKTRKYSYSFFVVLLTLTSSITGVTYAGKPTALFSMMLLIVGMQNRDARALSRLRTEASLTVGQN